MSRARNVLHVFLFAWHEFVSTIAISTGDTTRSEELWQEMSCDQPTLTASDRSGLLFAVATCAYTYLRQQVSITWSHRCTSRPSQLILIVLTGLVTATIMENCTATGCRAFTRT